MMLVAYVRPDEQRQAEPGQARARACLWIVTMKFSPVRIEEKPATKTPAHRHDIGLREGRAVRRVEGPAGVDARR